MPKLIECVPNFSEGRDKKIVEQIVASIENVKGTKVLGFESDADHNRTVITFVGSAKAVEQAAFQMAKKAVELVDLSSHEGVHPRLGALDVLPLIPLKDATFNDAIAISKSLGQRLGEELEIPIYLYEKSATTTKRQNLASVRRAGYKQQPDFGPQIPHPTAGATCLGAREILVAFNINLETNNLSVARKIARTIRESSGGIKGLKAIGLRLDRQDCVQVSMNLVDYKTTGMLTAYKAVKKLAAEQETEIRESELIGFAPKKAFEGASSEDLQLPNYAKERILDDALGIKI